MSAQRGNCEIPSEGGTAQLPQVFRDGSHRTQPTAKRFAEDERNRQERRKQEEACGMYARHLPGDQEVLQLHQPFDGQPAFDSGRPRDFHRAPAAFRPAHPQVELHPDPQVQPHQEKLCGDAQRLRVLTTVAADELLACGGGTVVSVDEKGRGGVGGFLDLLSGSILADPKWLCCTPGTVTSSQLPPVIAWLPWPQRAGRGCCFPDECAGAGRLQSPAAPDTACDS